AGGLRGGPFLGLCPRRGSPSGMGRHVHRGRARGRSGAGRAIRLTAAITAWEKLAMADGRGMLLVSALLMALPAAVVSRDAVAADGGQTFQACVPKRTRVLRLLDDGKSCRRRETTIEWSVQGPTGPTGPVGPTRATGGGGGGGGPEPGLGKAFTIAKQTLQIPLPPDGNLHVLSTFDLPAGSYLLQASAGIVPATRLGTSVGVCLFQTMTSG